MIAIMKKEIMSYFNSMIGYCFIGFFILIAGLYFSMICIMYGDPNFSSVLSNVIISFLILIPTITMRLISEEVNRKTDQLLLTVPTPVSQIVIGKYLAALALFLATNIVTFIFPIIASFFGKMPIAEIVGTYVGFFLLGSCFISVGLFISSLAHNQVTAAVATFAVLFVLFIMNGLVNSMPSNRNSSLIYVAVLIILFALIIYLNTKNIVASIAVGIIGGLIAVGLYFNNNAIFDGAIIKTLSWFSVTGRFNNFTAGIFDLSDCVYYLSFSSIFVYLTINVIEKRKWS